MNKVDIIHPLHTSGFGRKDRASFKDQVQKDIEWCDKFGVEYTPTISPGLREEILHSNTGAKNIENVCYTL